MFGINLSSYLEIGAGLSITYHDGTLAILGRLGVGIGAGVEILPDAEPSHHSKKCGYGYIARSSTDLSLGAGVWFTGLGVQAKAASGNVFETKQGGDFTSHDVIIPFDGNRKLGGKAAISYGVDVGSYSNW